MADIEEKDIQAFNELQSRVVELSEKQKFTQQQLQAANQITKRAALTAAELENLTDSIPTYEAVGKAYFLKPRVGILSSLQERAQVSSAEFKQLKAVQEGLQKGMQGIESEVRELLQGSPGLARAYASIGQ